MTPSQTKNDNNLLHCTAQAITNEDFAFLAFAAEKTTAYVAQGRYSFICPLLVIADKLIENPLYMQAAFRAVVVSWLRAPKDSGAKFHAQERIKEYQIRMEEAFPSIANLEELLKNEVAFAKNFSVKILPSRQFGSIPSLDQIKVFMSQFFVRPVQHSQGKPRFDLVLCS